MIFGIGTDIVEISRVRAAIDRHGDKIVRRILAPSEFDYYARLTGTRRVEFFAGRFAAKEAMGKALGRGLAAIRPETVAILQGAAGLRIEWLDGAIALEGMVPKHTKPDTRSDYMNDTWHVSISHSTEQAIAFVVWEKG